MSDQPEYPLVSAICLTGMHDAATVASCIHAFQAQTYPYKELIIINNAASQLEAANLNIEAQENVYLADTPTKLPAGIARNYGISAANGSIIAQFDANYWHHPKRLETQIGTIAANNSHACLLTRCTKASYNTGKINYLENDKSLIAQSLVTIKPNGVDYPPHDQGEELGFLYKMNRAYMKILTIEAPHLMCQVLGNPRQVVWDSKVGHGLASLYPHLMQPLESLKT